MAAITVTRLCTPEALDWRGIQAGHRIGDGRYDHCLQKPDSAFLSLRDGLEITCHVVVVNNGMLIILKERQPACRSMFLLAPLRCEG